MMLGRAVSGVSNRGDGTGGISFQTEEPNEARRRTRRELLLEPAQSAPVDRWEFNQDNQLLACKYRVQVPRANKLTDSNITL